MISQLLCLFFEYCIWQTNQSLLSCPEPGYGYRDVSLYLFIIHIHFADFPRLPSPFYNLLHKRWKPTMSSCCDTLEELTAVTSGGAWAAKPFKLRAGPAGAARLGHRHTHSGLGTRLLPQGGTAAADPPAAGRLPSKYTAVHGSAAEEQAGHGIYYSA